MMASESSRRTPGNQTPRAQLRYGRWLRLLATVQGAYFAVTGIWPLVHMASFVAVTGAKYDLWLVETVGVLVLAVGLALLIAAWRGSFGLELLVMTLVACGGLAAIDVNYSLRDRIWDIYLLDAVAEGVFIVLWLIAWFSADRLQIDSEAAGGL